MHYDTIIIGAGLSGLAAGIRLAHFGKKVCILESHVTPGGLNSYFRRGQRTFDVGLHAMTNFVPRGTRGAPLTKLLKQLRIPYDALELGEQQQSRIAFPECNLLFTNDFTVLREQVAAAFPSDADGFDTLTAHLEAYQETALDAPALSTRQELARFLREPLLIDMLLCPLMYYGNACADDMDFAQFAVMWRSIFREGFSRPRQGMRQVIDLLVERYTECGGELRLQTPVVELETRKDTETVRAVITQSGETLTATTILSSAGRVETQRLCSDQSGDVWTNDLGELSFLELIACLDTNPATLGIKDTIVFFSTEKEFVYRRPEGLADLRSGVICCPNNYTYADEVLPEGQVRITVQANYAAWRKRVGRDNPHTGDRATKSLYRETKEEIATQMLAVAAGQIPDFRARITYQDLFSPLTIRRYTGHPTGAVYGSPTKARDGKTAYANLYLLGTDQGFLGIVGALLSGITVANLYALK